VVDDATACGGGGMRLAEPPDLAARARLAREPVWTPGQAFFRSGADPSRPQRRSIPPNGAVGVACLGGKSQQ